MPKRDPYSCSDRMCGADDCRMCHPEYHMKEDYDDDDYDWNYDDVELPMYLGDV